MECPRPQDYRDARCRLAEATTAWTPGALTIQGRTVACAVRIGAETFELSERGPVRIGTLEARVPKAAVPKAPKQGDLVTAEGRAYKLTRIEGFMSDEVDWFLSGARTPGGDD